MRKRRFAALVVLLALTLFAADKKKLPRPSSWNLFSKQQDVQLGQEAAKQIEQQYQVIDNKELTDYVNRVGKRLVEQGELEKYPYFFKVVNDESINAFALPGGPMYVHTGLIKAADNEGQLAGVLAHELSHVVLRHGTSQATKANGIQIIAVLTGAIVGGNSMWGQLTQLGVGLGANSVLLKFSRGAEQDADLLGAYTMAKAGYNPLEMARFFEKLEGEGRKTNKLVEFFTSTHPNPGNRVKFIEGQLPYMPKSSYDAREGDLSAMKRIIDRLPPPPKKPEAGASAQRAERPPQIQLTGRYSTYQGRGVSFSHPDTWSVLNEGQNEVAIGPKEGVVGQSYGYAIIFGSASKQAQTSLAQATQAFVQNLAKSNADMRVDAQAQQYTIGGSPALVTRLSSESPYQNLREVDVLITIDRGNSMAYMICVSPESDYQRMEPVFQQATRTLQFR
jgi:predicted Zn-dependent protease